MTYEITFEYIPMDERTIVLAGMYLFDYTYAIRIGLFPGKLDREAPWRTINSPDQFRYLRLMHPIQRGSIFDGIEPAGRIDSAEVRFSESERFGNGTETIFEAFTLKLVLRTILPHDGGVTVLQFMVNHHGQSIGLASFSATDRYVSTVYEAIGGPLIEDKKNKA